MNNKFYQNISIDMFFEDGKKFVVNRESDYISYPEFLKYFSQLDKIELHNLIIGIYFTYGWMPTIFDFRSDKFIEALLILNDVKEGRELSVDNLILLKGLLNNSLVGTSKLLHFINPEKFAIWDSRVYRYLTNEEPYDYRIGNCNTYFDYLIFCNYLTKQKQFETLKESIEKLVCYEMTAFRILELVMYSNGNKSSI